MHVGIISDIHDNIWALAEVLARLRNNDALLCLGDLCAPFTLSAIAEGFSGPVHIVWGNNDGDKLNLTRNADRAGNITIHGDLIDLELGGRSIAMTHYPNVAKALAQGGTYDLVCCGHSHRQRIERVGTTLFVNPGEVMGRFGTRSYAVYDTERDEVETGEV